MDRVGRRSLRATSGAHPVLMNSVRRQKQQVGCFGQVIWEETANADVGRGGTGKEQQRGEWGGNIEGE